LFRIGGSIANGVPRVARWLAVAAAAAVLGACASNRGLTGVGLPITLAPAVMSESRGADLAETGLAVVTWNLHEGRGDVARLLASLRPTPVVLLLQEATRQSMPKLDDLGLFVTYVPSMPNGRGDDRGCAIASTLPLTNEAWVELPWVYQRRVAVTASVAGRADGRPFVIRFASVHLDNRPGRKRQAQWLAEWLAPLASEAPLIVGGDLNTWFGAQEDTVRAVDAVVPRVAECGDQPTFRFGRRLDHLFTTLDRSSRRGCVIPRDTFGSDHHPVVLRLLR
jgi:endonuclease/exonuclease/phosphatase family metal-dependent hydrolase